MKNKLIYYSPYIPFIGGFVHMMWAFYYPDVNICTASNKVDGYKHIVVSGVWQGLCYSVLLIIFTN